MKNFHLGYSLSREVSHLEPKTKSVKYKVVPKVTKNLKRLHHQWSSHNQSKQSQP